jgi:hypothetical protein
LSDHQLKIPPGKKLGLTITPLGDASYLPGRISGVRAAECAPTRLGANACMCGPQGPTGGEALSQQDLIELESLMRDAVVSAPMPFLLGLNANPVSDIGGGQFMSVLPQQEQSRPGSGPSFDAAVGLARGGIYQLMSFPISRLNGVPLPADSRIRFADPARWLQGGMESRLFTVTVNGTKKYYAFDAHAPVGKTNHAFYHVNQKGMHAVMGQADHAALTGAALIQAKQLRYIKLGGRIFLVVGVVVDGIQLAGAVQTSVEQESVRPVAAQTLRTAGSWAMAWAGAKAGVMLGAAAGVETGPGVVLTAIGGGVVGGVAGYLGADWIADWIYED